MSKAEEIMANIPPSQLNSTIEDIDIAKLAQEMTKWQELAPFLGLTPTEEEEIVEQYRERLQLQKREALRKWKEKNGSKATYRRLITIFCDQHRADLADALKKILLTTKKGESGYVTDIFHNYLVDCYSGLPHPSSLQWPNSMTCEQTFVDLNLLNVPVRSTDANEYRPIMLKSLFSAGNSRAKRKVILIEGVAGAGKTTLSWHAFKEWAGERLFEDIELLIHVSLSDPSIHSAKKIADLIPHPSETMRSNIAEAITDNHGQGVCFWFDGCDEAPPSLWESFLNQFVAGSGGRTMLPKAHIILTSRPGISLNLTSALTGKVIVSGFLSLHNYFAACLPEKGEQLIEALKMKPELYSLCNLPLHASILAYIFENVKHDLPTTRTGLFNPLIQNFIVRHILSRTPHQHPDMTNFPANLPDDIRLSFDKVTKLAFVNILHRTKVFNRDTMIQCGLNSINDTLGFLRACVSFTMCGPTEQFSFTHLSLQEFLAAFHISQMSKDKQLVAIKIVFDQNPNSPVLSFYAGITRLAIDEVREIFFKILSKPYDALDIVKKLGLAENQATIDLACDPRRQLLCLMNGLYEAQNLHLFAHVDLDASAKDIQDALARKANSFETIKSEKERDLPKDVTILFSYLYLDQTDCLSLGYFIRHACSQTENRVYLDLSCAVLRDVEIKALMQEMHKPASSHNVYLNVNCIFLSTDSLHSLSTLFNPQSCLIGFETSYEFFLERQLALKYLVEGITRSNCRQLTLGECSSQTLHYFIVLLMCQRLHVLALPLSSDMFTTPGAMRLFSEALKYSKLGRLQLSGCHINDESLALLAAAVCDENCLLVVLDIDRNTYTEDGLTHFLIMMLRSLQHVLVTLRVLSVDHYNAEHRKIVNKFNYCRVKYLKYPPLLVGSASELRTQNKEIKERREAYDALMRIDLAFQRPHH